MICLSDITPAVIDHYIDVFVRENVARVMTLYMKFESLTLTPFCLEKASVRKWYYRVLAMFSVGFWLESGKICKNNDHTCLFHCINTYQVPQEMFKYNVLGLMASCL